MTLSCQSTELFLELTPCVVCGGQNARLDMFDRLRYAVGDLAHYSKEQCGQVYCLNIYPIEHLNKIKIKYYLLTINSFF